MQRLGGGTTGHLLGDIGNDNDLAVLDLSDTVPWPTSFIDVKMEMSGIGCDSRRNSLSHIHEKVPIVE